MNRNLVCVLQFADNSATGGLGYFCRGLREEIVSRVSSLPGVCVLAWDGSGPGVRTAAVPGSVQPVAIIRGSVRASAETVRVTTQCFDTSNTVCLWSTSFDGPVTDTFRTHELVAAAVADRLGTIQTPRIGRREARPVTDRPPEHEAGTSSQPASRPAGPRRPGR